MEKTIITTKIKPKQNKRPNKNKHVTSDTNKLGKYFRKFQVAGGRMEDSKLPQRINDFRSKSGGALLREMRLYHKHVKDRYLTGLVHPDLAVQQQIPVKLYSDVPIPTASMGHHEQYEFNTNSSGNFLLSWRPCFLVTAPDLTSVSATDYSHLTFNNSAGLSGSVGTSGNFFVPGSYAPAVNIQRYRLVSALIKVSYNGNILNQAGTIVSCGTFDPLVAASGNGVNPVSGYADSLVDRFGNFNLIVNGLWNTTVDVTKSSEGVECLYVPTDPTDYTFNRQGRYYAGLVTSFGTITGPADGAHINYIIAGRNLPASSSCIMVNVYYNYEVVADPSAAPFLRSAPDTVFSSKDRDDVHNTISDVIKNGSLIKPSSRTNFTDILGQVAQMGLSYLPKLLSKML